MQRCTKLFKNLAAASKF